MKAREGAWRVNFSKQRRARDVRREIDAEKFSRRHRRENGHAVAASE